MQTETFSWVAIFWPIVLAIFSVGGAYGWIRGSIKALEDKQAYLVGTIERFERRLELLEHGRAGDE